MAGEKEDSDTLDRSNISSLQSDLTSKKSPEPDNNNRNLNKVQNCICQQPTLDSTKYVPYPLMNTNLGQTYQCPCQQMFLNGQNVRKRNDDDIENNEWERFNAKWPRMSFKSKKDKAYDIKNKNKKYRPDKTCTHCELGIPKNNLNGFKNVVENPIPMKHETNYETMKQGANYPRKSLDGMENGEKIEIYYFDHGNSAYYHTTDMPPILNTEKIAEKSNNNVTRCYAEFFGYVHIIVNLVTAFILQFLRCILFTFIRPLTIGIVQLIADYFIKPFLSITFNGIIQPILILFYNIATSVRDCCEPIASTLGFFMKELAVLVGSCRLIETNSNTTNTYT